MNRVTLSFTEPGARRKGFIEVEVNPTEFNYEALGELHSQVLDYIKRNLKTATNPNGFDKLRRSHGEAYVKEIQNTDEDKEFVANFIDTVYDLPAAASFINSNNKHIVDDYVNMMIANMERMTMTAGKRRTKRRNKKSKKSRKNRIRYRRY
jgi:hypothetical protein